MTSPTQHSHVECKSLQRPLSEEPIYGPPIYLYSSLSNSNDSMFTPHFKRFVKSNGNTLQYKALTTLSAARIALSVGTLQEEKCMSKQANTFLCIVFWLIDTPGLCISGRRLQGGFLEQGKETAPSSGVKVIIPCLLFEFESFPLRIPFQSVSCKQKH